MKIIRESLDFVRGRNSKEALNLGIEAQIEQWMNDTGLNSRYEIRDYGHGDVKIYYEGILHMGYYFSEVSPKLPEFIDFEQSFGLNMDYCNLEEFPERLPKTIAGVSLGHLNAAVNNFKSFKNFPMEIEGKLDVSQNFKLDDLDGFPEYVGGDVIIEDTGFYGYYNEKSFLDELRKRGCTVRGRVHI